MRFLLICVLFFMTNCDKPASQLTSGIVNAMSDPVNKTEEETNKESKETEKEEEETEQDNKEKTEEDHDIITEDTEEDTETAGPSGVVTQQPQTARVSIFQDTTDSPRERKQKVNKCLNCCTSTATCLKESLAAARAELEAKVDEGVSERSGSKMSLFSCLSETIGCALQVTTCCKKSADSMKSAVETTRAANVQSEIDLELEAQRQELAQMEQQLEIDKKIQDLRINQQQLEITSKKTDLENAKEMKRLERERQKLETQRDNSRSASPSGSASGSGSPTGTINTRQTTVKINVHQPGSVSQNKEETPKEETPQGASQGKRKRLQKQKHVDEADGDNDTSL